MAFVDWTQALETGNEKIDEQHHVLVDLINRLHQLNHEKKIDQINLEVTLDGLRNYTQYHFHTEEEIMDETNYPGTDSHKKSHNSFVKKIAEFEEDFKDQKAVITEELITYLVVWLKDHIQGTDVELVKFLIGKNC